MCGHSPGQLQAPAFQLSGHWSYGAESRTQQPKSSVTKTAFVALTSEATVGYIVPEYFKWPGFLSPSLGLKLGSVYVKVCGMTGRIGPLQSLLVGPGSD